MGSQHKQRTGWIWTVLATLIMAFSDTWLGSTEMAFWGTESVSTPLVTKADLCCHQQPAPWRVSNAESGPPLFHIKTHHINHPIFN